MKKFLCLLLFLLLIGSFASCDVIDDTQLTYDKPVVVLPDKETAETVNGYKPKQEETQKTESVQDTSSEDKSSSSSAITFENAGVVGNKNSLKYHAKDCRYATKISEENIALFKSADDAISEGYKPCGVCFKK